MAINVRTIAQEELEAFSLSQAMAFGRDYHPEHLEARRTIFEFDRNIAAFDGDELVGTAGIFSHEMTVPGGRVRSAGVTMVSVKPTHRRQGVLTQVMAAQLEHVAARGEPMATLWASESPIYGRFGYGLASETHSLEIPREYARFARPVEPRGRVRQMDTAEARETFPAIWDAAATRYPGFISRSRAWWEQRVFMDVKDFRDGFTANNYMTYEADGATQGYLRYRVKADWSERALPQGTVKVEELIPLTSDAYAALWNFAFNVDLVNRIEAHFRRSDEPLLHMLADARRLARSSRDGLWLRILDIPAALNARRYQVEGSLVLEVVDAFRPATSGNYLLEAGPGFARCERTPRPADLSLGIADLGAAYLGGTRLATLAEAGRVSGQPAAIDRADLMFAWPIAPWCPEMF
jgi:predicted acetyltransferase